MYYLCFIYFLLNHEFQSKYKEIFFVFRKQNDKTIAKMNCIANESLYMANGYDLLAVGVSVVMGGILYGWNSGFTSGFGFFIVAQFIMALAYIILMCCLAEIASAISFSGGSYGLSRVKLGFYMGFLVGYLELMQYSMYSASTIFYISDILTTACNLSKWYQPFFWFAFYAFCFFLAIQGRKWWYMNNFLVITTILMIIIYVFGSIPWVNIKNASLQNSSKLSDTSNWFQGN
jgi:amino acid transporter